MKSDITPSAFRLLLIILIFLSLCSFNNLLAYSYTWDPATGVLTVNSNDSGEQLDVCISSHGTVAINNVEATFNGNGILATDVKKLVVNGGAGNDIIRLMCVKPIWFPNIYENGDDKGIIVDGGGGANTIYATDFGDDVKNGREVHGYDGNDIIRGSLDQGCLLFGDKGNDKIYGGNQGDYIKGGEDDDELYGGAGNDEIYGETGNDIIKGGDEDMVYGAYNDKLYGGPQSDQIYGEKGSDLICGDDSKEEQLGENDYIEGGDGFDDIYGNGGDDEIHGGSMDDHIEGMNGEDVIYGDGGNDVIYGGDNNDILYGGDGMDRLFGNYGDDELYGEEGADELDYKLEYSDEIMDGNDLLDGGPGNDAILMDFEDNVIMGGSGNDIYKALRKFAIPEKASSNNIESSAQTNPIYIKGSVNVTDDDGDDTFDFSKFISGISLDMDMQGTTQIITSSGDQLIINGIFENIVGSDSDDEISVDPLTNIARNIDLGLQTIKDILNYDAQGSNTTNDGAKIISENYQEVNYSGVEEVNIINAPNLAPMVEVVFPNGGEYFRAGEEFFVKWKSRSVDKLKIEFSSAEEKFSVLVNEVDANLDSIKCIIPDSISTDCLIKISDASSGEPFDISDSSFEIGPELKPSDCIYTWDPELGELEIDIKNDEGFSLDLGLNSFGNFIVNGSGLTHKAGVPISGTLIKVFKVNGGAGNDVIAGDFKLPVACCCEYFGGFGDDIIEGSGNQNKILGGEGNDVLSGGPENDIIDGGPGDDILDGREGNDELYGRVDNDECKDTNAGTYHGGPGDDLYYLSNGYMTSANLNKNSTAATNSEVYTFNDDSGIDTLDFTEMSFGLTLDLAKQATDQVVNANGTIFNITGEFEYFKGTVQDDHISVSPSHNSPILIDGADQENEDVLIFDAQGSNVTDDGNMISAEGYEPVYYMAIEKVEIINAPNYSSKLTLVYPNGGEELILGEQCNVMWISTGNIQDVRIELTSDDGIRWETVENTCPNNGGHMWMISCTENDNYKLRISDADNPAVNDMSDDYFKIVSPTYAEEKTIPTEFELYQNYPNPFNPSTRINFALPEMTNVKLEVYDILGQIKNIILDKSLSAGEYSFIFDGSGLDSGIYFYKLVTDKYSCARKMILIR